MPRIYSNYSEEEILLLQRESEKMGFSLSAYQKYRTLLSLKDTNTFDIADLVSRMKETLAQKKEGDVFIVSSLLPEEWTSLTRSQKNTMSKTLKKIVTENPEKYKINEVLRARSISILFWANRKKPEYEKVNCHSGKNERGRSLNE